MVEDDDTIALPLVEGLERAGYVVQRTSTGTETLRVVDLVDMVLLDLGLPDIDGSELCRRLRALDDTPVIVVRARSDETETVLCFELGADDYVVKPFGMPELIARVRAVARRALGGTEVDRDGPQRRVSSSRPIRRRVLLANLMTVPSCSSASSCWPHTKPW